MDYDRPRHLSAIKSDGTVANPDAETGEVTFPSTGTWYVPLGDEDGATPGQTALFAALLKWSAALAATITFEWTNFPNKKSGSKKGPTDVSDYDGTAGNWVQDNVATDTYASPVVGTGNSITALTITAGGTNAGAVGVQLANRSARRYRLKVVITVVGTLRVGVHGKLGA